MAHLKHEKKINIFLIAGFIIQPTLTIMSFLIYPPDLTAEFPVYHEGGVMLMVCGGAFGIGALTLMGIKLADEKKVLPAAGFTMLAIASGVLTTSIFEITQIISYETYEKFYRIQTCGNFLYLPGMILVSEYTDFKKWTRYIGLLSSVTLITASIMFLGGNRNFTTLEAVSNIGYLLFFITFYSWAYNTYVNWKRKKSE